MKPDTLSSLIDSKQENLVVKRVPMKTREGAEEKEKGVREAQKGHDSNHMSEKGDDAFEYIKQPSSKGSN